MSQVIDTAFYLHYTFQAGFLSDECSRAAALIKIVQQQPHHLTIHTQQVTCKVAPCLVWFTKHSQSRCSRCRRKYSSSNIPNSLTSRLTSRHGARDGTDNTSSSCPRSQKLITHYPCLKCWFRTRLGTKKLSPCMY
ncbi:hypothetical protein FOQG_03189 [Fusarium oxysporum f. sp. raphani 54005]|uniref:Uncharacterized protein n=2 Tax=Fusarium oxysporum TaxID=5507 RepID=X0CNF0_FUSOX|nr:hypothetical protein FOQG_03189 [Fusarium oxysporum f. sp. raphani 54005]EXL89576.1 hypothetical protein FOPG_00222 [Fusarium oxysporum f. sp. conglutinans race 2 54008]